MRRHPVLFWLGALFFLRHMMRRGRWGYGGYGGGYGGYGRHRHHHHHRHGGFDYV